MFFFVCPRITNTDTSHHYWLIPVSFSGTSHKKNFENNPKKKHKTQKTSKQNLNKEKKGYRKNVE